MNQDTRVGHGEVEEHYQEREEKYRELNARAHAYDPGKFIIDCPGCGTPMLLGEGWKGLLIECPDCDDSADVWNFEPRISEQHADAIAAEETDIAELVRS